MRAGRQRDTSLRPEFPVDGTAFPGPRAGAARRFADGGESIRDRAPSDRAPRRLLPAPRVPLPAPRPKKRRAPRGPLPCPDESAHPVIDLVLLRHGESEWNRENRFTGWTDVDLTPKGRDEAREAGARLRRAGLSFDVAYTSVLKRAIRTLWLVLDAMDLMWIPVHRRWRLNERHYGDLQGLDKAETAARFGERQVLLWRRSFDVPPPPLSPADERSPFRDRRYRGIDPALLPRTECLKDTLARLMPCWEQDIRPDLEEGKRILIVAHGNSLRAIAAHLDRIGARELLKFNIPTGVPLVYRLDASLRARGSRYLGDPAGVEEAIRSTARPGGAAPEPAAPALPPVTEDAR